MPKVRPSPIGKIGLFKDKRGWFVGVWREVMGAVELYGPRPTPWEAAKLIENIPGAKEKGMKATPLPAM